MALPALPALMAGKPMALFKKFDHQKKGAPIDPLLRSIVQNLNHLLNTKKYFGYFDARFGIRDLSEYTSREAITQAVVAEVKENIELYEPRVILQGIDILDDPNPFCLSFSIECRILERAQSLHLVFDSFFSKFQVDDPLN
jgi:type VI secretion system lysozyme-like protein